MKRPILPLAVILAVVSGCAGTSVSSEPPSTQPSASASVIAESAEATPSGEPSADASASVEASPAGAPLAVGGLAEAAVADLSLRKEPGVDGELLGTLPDGSASYVVDGPVSADGHEWYLLSGLGLPQASGCAGPLVTDPFSCPVWFGWAASRGADGVAWLEPAEPTCPEWPTARLTNDLVIAVQRVVYLACFGDEPRTTVGYFPEVPGDAGLGGACPIVPLEMSWIGCNLGYTHIVPDEATDFFGPGLVLAVDPNSEVQMPNRGQWIEVTGQYDHPAAAECTWGDPPEQSQLECRVQFVVESARAVEPPA